MTHLDLDPDVVAGAGQRTAATASDWETWASRSETLLRNAAGDARDSSVTPAVEGYLSQLNPTLKSVAKQVDTLGTNTVSASHTVSNSDTTAAALLGHQGLRLDSQTSALQRPINP